MYLKNYIEIIVNIVSLFALHLFRLSLNDEN